MDKKYIAVGVAIWASISGYMGLRVLEGYTEDAVYASLSVMSAEAKEIRYSFLTNSLTIKGIEYDIPDEKVMHKGSIEQVEVKNFNRKIMFVMPNMPAYNADDLPRVVESVTITGITDMLHQGDVRIDRKIGSVEMSGWHQRIGMLLDRYTHDGITEKFYEELYRCRIDELNASQIDIKVMTSKMEAPVVMNIGEAALLGGIKAPRGEEKNTPFTLAMRNITFGQGIKSGSVLRIDLRDFLAPEPAMMGKLVAMAVPKEKEEPAVTANDVLDVLRQSYADRAPFSLLSVQGFSFKNSPEATPVTLNSATYALNYSGEAVSSEMKLKDMHIRPAMFGEMQAIVTRFAPEGLHADIESKGVSSPAMTSGNAAYELRGLGRLEAASEVFGAFDTLEKMLQDGGADTSELLAVLSDMRLKKAQVHYKDSGLLAMAAAMVAEKTGTTSQKVISELESIAQTLTQDDSTLLKKLGMAFEEQLKTPGEFNFILESEAAVSFKELFMMYMLMPEKLPIDIQSAKGIRSMQEYLVQ